MMSSLSLSKNLRIEFGLPQPLHAIFLHPQMSPTKTFPSTLEATTDRSWVTLLTIVLKAEKICPDWLGAHFRFRVELKQVVDNFYNIQLWPGAEAIRVRSGDPESYRAVSLAVVEAIEAKLRDPKAQGPERVVKREIRPKLATYYLTGLRNEPLGRTYLHVVPRVGESVAINQDFYRVVDVVWFIEDASHTSATVILRSQPPPQLPNPSR